jgi:hypothetical protein
MARSVEEGFDLFFSRLVPLVSEREAATKHRASVEASLRKALNVHLFREIGSFNHGTGVRSNCDVDLLVSLKTKPQSSDTALRWVREALEKSFPFTPVRVRRPAVVVEFNAGAEAWEVIPGFRHGGTDVLPVYDIPDVGSGWLESAPTAHLAYVSNVNKEAGIVGGAKKLARLMKTWKYYNAAPVSSFYLEMRAAKYMSEESSFVPIFEVSRLLSRLRARQLAAMNDPLGLASRFYACSSQAKATEALSKLNTAAARAEKALDAHLGGDPATAFSYLDLLFGYHFPAR